MKLKRNPFKNFNINLFLNLDDITVEHILSVISTVHYITICYRQDDPMQIFLKLQASDVFYFIPYSPWIAVVGKIVNLISTFCWNFMDLFVMIISIGLSTRFKQINDDLQRIKGEVRKKMMEFRYDNYNFFFLQIDRLMNKIFF